MVFSEAVGVAGLGSDRPTDDAGLGLRTHERWRDERGAQRGGVQWNLRSPLGHEGLEVGSIDLTTIFPGY